MTKLELWRLLMSMARHRQRVGLEVQRRRLVRSIVANDLRRRLED